MKITNDTREWLLGAEEPYLRFNVKRFFDMPADRAELLDDPFIKENIKLLGNWKQEILKNHSRPQLLIHKLALLADLGVAAEDKAIKPVIDTILKNLDENGIPRVLIELPTVFGGSGVPELAWMICDFPVILGALIKMGVRNDLLNKGLAELQNFAGDNGYGCKTSYPNVRGPGRKDDFCPYVNILCAKVLSEYPEGRKSRAAGLACETLLFHWETQGQKKHYLFGIGTDYKKLKYPFVWYNILHAVDVISRFEQFVRDKRFLEMVDTILAKSDNSLRFKPESVYMIYKNQDFGNKKEYSRMITLAVLKILKRIGTLE